MKPFGNVVGIFNGPGKHATREIAVQQHTSDAKVLHRCLAFRHLLVDGSMRCGASADCISEPSQKALWDPMWGTWGSQMGIQIGALNGYTTAAKFQDEFCADLGLAGSNGEWSATAPGPGDKWGEAW